MKRFWWLPAALGLLAGGCADQEVKRVFGVVTLDGKPLAGAEVKFWPKDDLKLNAYTAITRADGTFEIFKDPRPGTGLKPGRYVILVAKFGGAAATVREDVAAAPAQEGFMPGTYNTLPSKYNDKDKCPFVVALHQGDNDCPLPLESGKKK